MAGTIDQLNFKVILDDKEFTAKVKQDIQRLIKQKKLVNPLFYKKDKHFKRKLYLAMRQVNYYKKYKENVW